MTDASQMSHTDERPTKLSIWRGLCRKCPNCGEGHMFDGYLTVADSCTVCDQTLSHHRADDGPAYLTIMVVAHILGFAIHFVWVAFRPDPVVLATIFTVSSVALSLFLLPRLKGLVVAIQWAKRMHGFGTPG